VAVLGGQSTGRCRIDRRTGLPLDSHIEQSVQMRVRLADATEFEQHKLTTATLATPASASSQPLHSNK
jgi:hypothetical protein